MGEAINKEKLFENYQTLIIALNEFYVEGILS